MSGEHESGPAIAGTPHRRLPTTRGRGIVMLHADTRRGLRAQIARQRDRALDWEFRVDEARADVDLYVDVLRKTVRERNRAARYLSDLLELRDEIQTVRETFGPEIASTLEMAVRAEAPIQ
jgi:hypothetical protein